MDNDRFCPHCGGTLSSSHRFCPHCGRAMGPGSPEGPDASENPARSRMQFGGGLLLPGLYVPFGQQSAGTRRWGWIIALALLALTVVPLLFSLLFSGLFFRF